MVSSVSSHRVITVSYHIRTVSSAALALTMRSALFISFVFVFTLVKVNCATPNTTLQYVGCFDPNYAINQNYHHHMLPFSLQLCVTYCKDRNARYTGVEASDNFCYCGGDIPEQSEKRPDSVCDMPCPGEGNKTCGGDWLISVYDMAPDSKPPMGDVSFLIGTSIGSRLYNASDLSVYETMTTSAEWAYAVDYHLARNTVYVFSSGGLYKSTLEPKKTAAEATPSKVAILSNCEGFAVDWAFDRIYWADCNKNNIMVMDLEGGNSTTVLKKPGVAKVIKRMEVDPHQGKLFWTAEGTLESCRVSGEDFRTNMSGPGVIVRALALDLPTRLLYYVGTMNGTTSLYSMDYDANSNQYRWSIYQMKSVYGLGIFRNYVYWVNYANVRDVIFKAPLQGNGSVELLKSVDRAVWHMKVVHPDLQKHSRSDPCEKTHCSHYCVPKSATTAECRCPDGQTLGSDKATCSRAIDFHYAGCYDAQYAFLQQYYVYMRNITLEKCLTLALANGKTHAGIVLSERYCFFGDDIEEESVKRDDSECPTPCPDYLDQKCGGDWLISLYELSVNKTFHGDNVGFLIGMSDGVHMFSSKDAAVALDVIMSTSHWSYTVDYHYAKNLAFASARGIILSSTMTPKNASDNRPKLVKLTSPTCDGFAVDWVSDRIFWADCTNYTIMAMDLEGKNVTTVLTRPLNGTIKRMLVDPYESKLFWTSDGTIESCGLLGEDFRTNLSGPGVMVRAITLDLPTRRIYYVGITNSSASLYSIDYGAANRREHWSVIQMKSVYGMGIFRNYMYWVNYADIRDVVYKAPLNLTGHEDVEKVKVIDKAVWHMRIVHRDLQMKPKGDPCVDKGCSHTCEAKTPSSATCQCPANHTLDADGVTCISREVGRHSALGMVGGSILLVIVILALAGALVYLADTHWTGFHSKLMRLSMRQPRRTENDNPPDDFPETTEDNVHLI